MGYDGVLQWVRDHVTAVAWYNRLSIRKTGIRRFRPGFPALVTIERGPTQLFFSEHTGDARPDTTGAK